VAPSRATARRSQLSPIVARPYLRPLNWSALWVQLRSSTRTSSDPLYAAANQLDDGPKINTMLTIPQQTCALVAERAVTVYSARMVGKRDAPRLDGLDRAVLQRLQEDGRVPFSELANALGMSEGTVRNRVNRMKDLGVLRIIAVTEPSLLGYSLDCIIGLEVELGRVETVAARLTEYPELRYVGIATGPYDIIIAGDFASERHLLEFLTRTLAQIDGIRRTETSRILQVHKRFDGASPTPAEGAPERAPGDRYECANRR
jgi:Lrp/AsnC family transcriptional regulator for asnA, asnC and gidA